MSVKNVSDWTVSDVLAWLDKNKRRLESAEALQVYVQQESITGETLLGLTKQDCSRFGLIRPNILEKILDKLRKENDKIKKEERKRTAKKTKNKKSTKWGGDSKDSGVDDCSVSESVDGRRPINILHDSDSPSSANTSGTASFGVSVSGGSTHMHVSNSVQSVTYACEDRHGRPVVEEATYIAPEEIHRTSWVEPESQADEEYIQPDKISSHVAGMPCVPKCQLEGVVRAKNYYESTIKVNVVVDEDGQEGNASQVWSAPASRPVLSAPPSRPVPILQPNLYPTLPDPVFDPGPDAVYENYEAPCESGDVDTEWDYPDQTYINQDAEVDEYPEEDPNAFYMNNPEASSSEEESSQAEGQIDLEDMTRRLTMAMKETKAALPSRPPVLPPPSPMLVGRRPAAPPLAPIPTPSPKPPTPFRDVITTPPPLPPNKPKHVFESNVPEKRVSIAAMPPPPVKSVQMHKQSTVPNIPISPARSGSDSGTLTFKERMEMLNKLNTKEPERGAKRRPLKHIRETTGVSVKERQQRIGNLFGGAGPMLPPPPSSSAPTSSVAAVEKKYQPPTPPPQPPQRGGLPPPPPVTRLPPPLHTPPPVLPGPPPPISTNLSTGCYEDVEIVFPAPRAPLPPPPGGVCHFLPARPDPGCVDDDDSEIYALEDDALEDPEAIYNDGEDEVIRGYHPEVSTRQQAEQLLRNDPRNECYLIRDSTSGADQYPHVISLKANSSYEHTRLGSRQNDRLAIGTAKPGESTHASLAELVIYHETIPLNLRGRNVLLKYPVQIS